MGGGKKDSHFTMDKKKNVRRDEWIVELILKTENMT